MFKGSIVAIAHHLKMEKLMSQHCVNLLNFKSKVVPMASFLAEQPVNHQHSTMKNMPMSLIFAYKPLKAESPLLPEPDPTQQLRQWL